MTHAKKLILVGSRNNIEDILLVAQLNGYEVEGILDSHYWGNKNDIGGVPVIGSEHELLSVDCQWRDRDFFLASWWTGEQDLSGQGHDGGFLRQQRIRILESSGVNVANLIHPDAKFFYGRDRIRLGHGVLILGGTTFATDTEIGDYCVIDWRAAIASHVTLGTNVIVGSCCTVAHAHVGDNSRLGVGSICVPTKRPTVTIGHDSVVYVGSIVLDDVPPDSVYTMHHRTRSRVAKSPQDQVDQ